MKMLQTNANQPPHYHHWFILIFINFVCVQLYFMFVNEGLF